MSAYDTDDDVFVTQPCFTNTFEVDINSDFETLLNSDLNTLPNSNVGQCEFIDFEHVSSGSDSDLYKASQNIESNLVNFLPCNPCSHVTSSRILQRVVASEQSVDSSSARFGQPVSDLGLKKFCKSAYLSNTENKCKWALGLYQDWVKDLRKRGRTEDMELNPDIVSLAHKERELNKNLMFFITEVRNKKGEDYRGNTLYEIISSLQYYIRRNGTQLNFFESPVFHGLRSVLDARMKSLAAQGIGTEKRQAQVISVVQEDVLWEKEILDERNPQRLLDTMVYLIGLNCALRAGDEHKSLRTGSNSQFEIIVGDDGCKRLKYKEDVLKTYRGRLMHRKCERKCVIISQDFERPERCLVRLYQKYMSLRPKDGKCTAFYLRPLKFIRDDTWYADIPVGMHPLRGTVRRLCKMAGFSGFYSNHSLRATTATTAAHLYDHDSGLEEQLTTEKTGHASLAIRSLKRTSAEMEARVDGVFQRKSTEPETAPTSTISALTSTDEMHCGAAS